MLYILTFTAGIAVAAVLMWYFVGVVTKGRHSARARLDTTTAYVYAAPIRAGRDPEMCQVEAIMLARELMGEIDAEAVK